jgi:metal-responsive CopG/Arc/MetJ family transcriptional regulator
MRATLNIPDDLMREVQQLSGEKSKTSAIVAAMEAFVRQKKTEDLLALKGKIQIDYDWEAEEEKELVLQEERENYGKS